jgi:hypothetical protein
MLLRIGFRPGCKDDGCPVPVGNMWQLDATCSRNSVPLDFHCLLKTSVTRFPLTPAIHYAPSGLKPKTIATRIQPTLECYFLSYSYHKLQMGQVNELETSGLKKKGVYNGCNDNYIPINESRAQNFTHTFHRYEKFVQHTRVSLFGKSNEATLNLAFIVKYIICHAQLILLPTSPIVSMQLHSMVPICLNLSSLKTELLWMTCSNKYIFAIESMATFRSLSREQDCRSVSRMMSMLQNRCLSPESSRLASLHK